jgi:hypothetical protein
VPTDDDHRFRPARRHHLPPAVRHDEHIMIGFTLLLFPFVLLGFVLLMGRVEEPLSQIGVERDIEQFLDDANKSELDTFVREGTESALRRFRKRLGITRLRRSRGELQD